MSVISLSGNVVRTFHQSASFVVATTISTSRIAPTRRAAPRRLSRAGSKINETLDDGGGGDGGGGEKRERDREGGKGKERNCVSRRERSIDRVIVGVSDGRETTRRAVRAFYSVRISLSGCARDIQARERVT